MQKAKAHWVSRDTIAWNTDVRRAMSFKLHFDAAGGLELSPHGVKGGQKIDLILAEGGLGDDVSAKFPHLQAYGAFKIGPRDLNLVTTILKGQVAVSAVDTDGDAVDATSVQLPGVLDDLYTYDGPLGVIFDGDIPILKVWAPTAQSVRLHLFDDANPETCSQKVPMNGDPETGVWHTAGEAGWTGKYYLYEVEVYVPSTGRVENNLVTDPYSVSLSMNSKRSQIVDLEDGAYIPEGREWCAKPPLVGAEDIVLYELHVRDFSMNDGSVPEAKRGTFLAFTEFESHGMQHLRQMAEAGLTHIHLLPVFDFATIDENRAEWMRADFDALARYPPDSAKQQEILSALVGKNGYNWGYDPFHYTVPEGSYATDPHGPTRILEFRQMVRSLNLAGLRVVMDVVYNHTNASGQNEKSVLDRLVPGYYHRLDAEGKVERSTCCENTATEHNMMRKLMVDSVITWATAYKVDGFRFDLMGHHMVADMVAVKEALKSLTLEAHGVDGSKIYVYGEGWDFGEVANNARGANATQKNLAGMGIGTFNDRMRDALRGGSVFGGSKAQGFINGLYYDPNEVERRSEAEQSAKLLRFADQIRVGLAGNLADYRLVNWKGQRVTGADVPYDSAPTGYTQAPQEHIVYISAHDNETLFDAIQYKAPDKATVQDRVRMHNLGISIVALSQGVPFFHAGIDMLRSKSFDRDSFDSGDWFNKLDFTYQDNNYGAGLPPAKKNKSNWPIIKPLLARPELKPEPDDILCTVRHFQEMLRIRKSSPLFRLRTAAEVQERLRFHNTGPDQALGMIVMSLTDVGTLNNLDPNYDMILAVFNATNEEQRFTLRPAAAAAFALHPIQAQSSDPVVRTAMFEKVGGTFLIPARTAAVFVAAVEGLSGLPLTDSDRIELI